MRRFLVELQFAHPLAINGKRLIHAEIFALGHEEARKDVRAVCEQFTKAVPIAETSEDLGEPSPAPGGGEEWRVTKSEVRTAVNPFVHSEWGNAR